MSATDEVTPLLRADTPLASEDGEEGNRKSSLPVITHQLLFGALIATLAGPFLVGYSLIAVNNPQQVFEYIINSTLFDDAGTELQVQSTWAAIVAALPVGIAIGHLLCPPIADRYGRTRALVVACLLNCWAVLLMSGAGFFTSPTAFLLTAGRLFAGIAAGLGTTTCCTFLSEIAPTDLRGLVGGCVELMQVVGKLTGCFLSLPAMCGTRARWPWLMGFPAVPTVFALVGLFFIPDSPKYLQASAEDGDRSLVVASIRYYHGITADVAKAQMDVDAELSLVSKRLSVWQIFRSTTLRRMLLLAVVISTGQIFTGVTIIAAFSTSIFDTLGVAADTAVALTLGMIVASLLWTVVGVLLVERVSTDRWPIYVCVLAMFGHCMVFGVGAGPVPWFVVPEFTPQHIRSTVTAAAAICNSFVQLVLAAAFPPLQALVGSFAFLLFMTPLLVCNVYISVRLPETRHNSVDVNAARVMRR